MNTPHPSLGMGKSPGRFGAPRGPRQPWERFPGRRCYFGRVKQEGEGCRGKFNAPPAGPAPLQAGMKTIRGERKSFPWQDRLPPAPLAQGQDRTVCPGSELRHLHPPAPFLRIIRLRDGVWGWIIPLDHQLRRGALSAPRASVSPGVWSSGSGLGQPPLSGKGSASGAAPPAAPTARPGLSTGSFLPPEAFPAADSARDPRDPRWGHREEPVPPRLPRGRTESAFLVPPLGG